MSVTDIVPDLDFSELDDDGATPPADGPVTGSRGGGGGRRGPAPGTPRKPRAPTAKRLEALKDKLSGQMFMAGSMAGIALPVTGMYACQESANFCGAVVDLASQRPEWIEALEKLALLEPGLIVGRTTLGLGNALAVDRGRAKPDSRVSMFLGVTEAWMRLQEQESGSNAAGGGYTPPPFKFTPV